MAGRASGEQSPEGSGRPIGFNRIKRHTALGELKTYLTLILLALPQGNVYQKLRFKFKKGSSKKFPMSVAPMSR